MAAEPRLSLRSLIDGGTTVVSRLPFRIGRDPSCDLSLENDPEASRIHAQIFAGDRGELRLRDSGSRNGTFLNGDRIPSGESVELGDGDELKVGLSRFQLDLEGTLAQEETRAAGATPSEAPTEPDAEKAAPPPPERPAGSGSRTPLLVGLAVVGVLLIAGALLLSGVFDSEKSTSDLVAEARPSTVLVIANKDGRRDSNGSGWVYDAEEGLIVTNAHVVDGGEDFEVGVEDDPALREATVMGVAPCDDLAMLRVSETEGLRTMPLGSQDEIEQGDRLLALGYPLNGTTQDEVQVTDGVVSVVETRADEAAMLDPDFAVYPNVIQTDAAINGGNSGGPSITSDGKLAGVNTLGSLENQNQNFAVGVDRVKELAPTLASGDSIGWGGFAFAAVTADEMAQAGLPDIGQGGLLVTSIVPGTGAEQGQILVNDLVTAINGQPVETRQDYCNAVQAADAGELIPVEVLDSQSNYSRFYDLRIPFD